MFGRVILSFIHELGEFLFFTKEFFHWVFQRPFRSRLVIEQMEFIGVKSLPIILLTGAFTGMVFGLQTGYAFRLFNAGSFVGSTVGLALTREIAPVFTALMVVARCGSSMAATIGTMKVTEQVDALMTMAVNPIHYLVVPRVIASFLMMPLLAGVFIGIGTLGAYLVAVGLLNIDPQAFMQKLTYYVDMDDVMGGLIKAAIFGFFLSMISCERGYRTTKGAEGVGLATTQAVVISSVSILMLIIS